jgi:probable HAF family extracellular repeat protein
MKTLSVRVFLSFVVVLFMGNSLSAQSYNAFFLGSGRQTYVSGVNNSGMSVGRKGISYSAALLWSPNGTVHDLGNLGGKYAEALAINNLGQVVGDSSLAGNSVYHAFLWTPNGGMQDLGSLGGHSFAYAINDNTQVVGEFRGTVAHAFLWTQTGGLQDLGTLGGSASRANGINAAGHVVGSSSLSNGSQGAFFWTAQEGMKQIDLGQTTFAQAFAINDSDQVVGSFVNPNDNQNHGFLWSPTTGMHDLGTLPGGSSSASLAQAINNSGDVVGIGVVWKAGIPIGKGASVIWSHGGTIKKLGQLVVPKMGLPSGATGINASGQIVANGGGAYLLTPR